MENETLRDRVKKLCRESGTSAYRLEHELGFGNGYISKLNDTNPNMGKLRMIADYFHVTTDYLMTGENKEAAEAYYVNEKTARIAQAIYDDRTLSLLFDEARDASPEDLMQTYSLLKYLKEKERKRGD